MDNVRDRNVIFLLRILPSYGPMGPSMKQGCNKTSRTGTLQPAKVGLVGRSAVDFFVPLMVGGVTTKSPKVVTWETKRLQTRFAIAKKVWKVLCVRQGQGLKRLQQASIITFGLL